MGKCITFAIAGLGSRGKETYAQVIKKIPEKMKITAIADVNPDKLRMTAEEFGITEAFCFSSVEEMLEKERLADVLIVATQDRQHVKHAIPALKKGYHILLEKPISPIREECEELLKVAQQWNRKVVVCHVLRYTPIYRKVKEILDAGIVGDIVAITANENVGWWHQAHSFVRGNWRNSNETSPMILAKCCHDMDLYLWLANKTCRSVSSFGSNHLFKKEMAPEGCARRCLDGCKVKDTCPFDAEAIYLKNEFQGYDGGNREWPLDVLIPGNVSRERIAEELEKGPYGRCVYYCDNNVVDHQVVNLRMTDDTTMSFTMCGFTSDISRSAKFMGTKGELNVFMIGRDLERNEITVRLFDAKNTEISIDVSSLADDFSMHGGGDRVMVEEFVDLLRGEKEESPYITSLEKSLESHYCAFAAEESRVRGGEVVDLCKTL
ncbi:MAG: Gfo/Idh/MocA family protein [Dorea sp.]